MKKFFKKCGQVLACLIPILATLGIQLAVSIPVIYYYVVIEGALGIGDFADPIDFATSLINEISAGDLGVYITVAWGLSSMLVFILWFRHIHNRTEDLNLKLNLSGFSLLGLLLIVLGMQVAIQYGYSIWEGYCPKLFEEYNELLSMDDYSPVAYAIMMVYGTVLAPIHEEFLCRGVLLHYTKKVGPFFVANILQALLFGLLHMNLVQGSYAFIVGLMLGYIYREAKTLWIPIIFHMAFNFFGTLVPLMPLTSTSNTAYIIACTVGILITVSGFVLYNASVKIRDEKY